MTEHALAATPPADEPPDQQGRAVWIGPSGRKRVDPHMIRRAMPRSSEGRRRIDRTAPDRGVSGDGQFAPALQVVHGKTRTKPTVTVAVPASYLLVVPDLPDGRLSAHDRDVLGAARALADATTAVTVLAFGTPADDLGAAGADRVMVVPLDGYAPERRAAAVVSAIESLAPAHVLVPDSPLGGADLGRRVAARTGERVATGVFHLADGRVRRAAAGGSRDQERPPSMLMLLAPECAEPVTETLHEARPIERGDTVSPPRDLDPRLVDEGLMPVDPRSVPLAEAEFIVSAGRGVTDHALFHRIAEALGATEGASRVAVDDGFMPRDRQVGATGTLTTARVYLSFGISGAPQHLQGIARCETVVAVNTDASCDMVKRADLAVIADAQAVMAALAELREDKP